jgi:hypothetical protein
MAAVLWCAMHILAIAWITLLVAFVVRSSLRRTQSERHTAGNVVLPQDFGDEKTKPYNYPEGFLK